MTRTRRFDPDWINATGIAAGLRAIVAGEQQSVTFALLHHPREKSPWADGKAHPFGLLTLGYAVVPGHYNGRPVFRDCGAGNDPLGAGSSTVARDIVEAAAMVGASVGRWTPRRSGLHYPVNIYRQEA